MEHSAGISDRLLCRMSWTPQGFHSVMVAGAPIAWMARHSHHAEIKAHAFEAARTADMEALVADLKKISRSATLKKLAVEVYKPNAKGRTRMQAEINDFEVHPRCCGPAAIAKALHKDLMM